MAELRGKSGSIQLTNKYHLFARINWWEDYSIEENYSIISAEMEMKAEEYAYTGTWYPGGNSAAETGQILIGGETIASMTYYNSADHKADVSSVAQWAKVTNADGSAAVWSSGKIYHNADGTGATTIATTKLRAYRQTDGTNHTFGTVASQAITLTAIPIKSGITSAATVTLGKACSVRWTPLSTGFQYKLKFSLGDWSYTTGYIKPNTTSAYTYTGYTIPLEVASQLPNTTSGTMTVTLYTYNGSTNVGETFTVFEVTVPDNASTRPTITDLALTAVDTPFAGVFVQGNSKVEASFTGSGKYGAEIVSAKMTVEGKTYAGEFTSDYISGYGDIKVSITVTDSRGFSGTKEGTIRVCAYSKPQVKVSVCQRCDAEGNADDMGAYLMISASRSYSKVVSGTQHNFCTLRYRYTKQGEAFPEAWTTLLESSDSGDTVETGALLGNLTTDALYIVQIGVMDTVGNTSETSYTIITEVVFMHEKEGGNGIGFGMYCAGDNRMDVAWAAHFHGGVNVEGMTLKEYILAVISEGG